MENQIETFDSFLHNAIMSNSNCILIGEDHNKCPALFPLINFLLSRERIERNKKFIIFHERFFALGANFLTPYDKGDILKLPAKRITKSLLDLLIENNIDIFGLEIQETDPFRQFNVDNFVPNEDSLNDLILIMRKYNLEEIFQNKYEKNITEFIEEHGFETGWVTVASIFAQLPMRIAVPNEKFCELINMPDEDVVRIVIVGNTHIPRVIQQDNGSLIDIGMKDRLKTSKKIHNLAVMKITSYHMHEGNSYEIQEQGNQYLPIEQVCFVNLDEVDENLKRLIPNSSPRRAGFFSHTEAQPDEEFYEIETQKNRNVSRCCSCCRFF